LGVIRISIPVRMPNVKPITSIAAPMYEETLASDRAIESILFTSIDTNLGVGCVWYNSFNV